MSAFERSRETAGHPHSAPIDTSVPEDIDTYGIATSAPGHQAGFERERERERKGSMGGGGNGGGGPSPRLSQRAQQTLQQSRHTTSPGVSGLSAAYSTSLPNSGGYFAQGLGPDGGELDERRQRQRDRENKRKAMQAAWGVDIRAHSGLGAAMAVADRESPLPQRNRTRSLARLRRRPPRRNTVINVSPGGPRLLPLLITLDRPAVTDDPQPVPVKTGRSPGPRIGLGKSRSGTTPTGNTPPSPAAEYFANGDYGEYANGSGAKGGAGLTRTKSLMQRIKAMVSVQQH